MIPFTIRFGPARMQMRPARGVFVVVRVRNACLIVSQRHIRDCDQALGMAVIDLSTVFSPFCGDNSAGTR
jgi:hypothetical protein